MAPTKQASGKAARKAPVRKAASAGARTRRAPARKAPTAKHAENDRLIRRITDSLDVAQADLGHLRGSVGSGVGDLRRDLAKLLRSARRDAERLGKAARKDLERLQRDVASAATRPRATKSAASRNGAKAAAKRKSR
jgi:hypothetical protein